MYDRYQLPLLIAENGLVAKDVVTDDGHIHDGVDLDEYPQKGQEDNWHEYIVVI